ncbi:nucleotidyl transferase AbiEii/AbiGii toxin family protein [Candidatus Dojkabacteria bacterium]|nr:nucleotidyl transferase AbiEii/AbiGii toxin family protein [Candidatus Dojkabacteria bacterium]
MKSLVQQHAVHKQWMLRLLSEIADNNQLAQSIAFKGGSCASLLSFLDRFSVDLDFDLLPLAFSLKTELRSELYKIFDILNLTIDQESKTQLQFFLKYKSKPNERNTLKLEIIDNDLKANAYKSIFIPDINRYLQIQTIETMFANKLVAPVDRYEKHGSIATRDIYDINFFFNQGFSYNKDVIIERRNKTVKEYFNDLIEFIDAKITNTLIVEDLNYLLTPEQFRIARKFLKSEVINNIKGALNSEN